MNIYEKISNKFRGQNSQNSVTDIDNVGIAPSPNVSIGSSPLSTTITTSTGTITYPTSYPNSNILSGPYNPNYIYITPNPGIGISGAIPYTYISGPGGLVGGLGQYLQGGTFSGITFSYMVGGIWSRLNSKNPSELDYYHVLRIRGAASGVNIIGFIHRDGVTNDWDGPWEIVSDEFSALCSSFSSAQDISDTVVMREIFGDVHSFCTNKETRRDITLALLAASTTDLKLEEDINVAENLYKPYLNKILPF